jgi:hypothetical protein
LFFSTAVCKHRRVAFHVPAGRFRSSEPQLFLSLRRSPSMFVVCSLIVGKLTENLSAATAGDTNASNMNSCCQIRTVSGLDKARKRPYTLQFIFRIAPVSRWALLLRAYWPLLSNMVAVSRVLGRFMLRRSPVQGVWRISWGECFSIPPISLPLSSVNILHFASHPVTPLYVLIYLRYYE